MIEFDPDAEAAAVMAEAGIEETELNELALDGIPIALDLIVQCQGCLERGVETALRLTWNNRSGVDLSDLHVECNACTDAIQGDAPGVRAVIPVVLACGQDAEDIDAALELADSAAGELEASDPDDPGALPEIDDSSHPFRGPATAERPAPQPVDE